MRLEHQVLTAMAYAGYADLETVTLYNIAPVVQQFRNVGDMGENIEKTEKLATRRLLLI